ncbi:hypothetical protein CTEN210_04115 [Chaetoceros tenuissimus]|uniref:Methyltransferase FkbM domain-containing protein n=1 Tax=Chaetoceros tenuissimus TaxID=426638 RepID=A0AAD3CMW3_9STRA|nr:hypothetical protein CTEN210_04115 [Chaetoceros tenuissimus]
MEEMTNRALIFCYGLFIIVGLKELLFLEHRTSSHIVQLEEEKARFSIEANIDPEVTDCRAVLKKFERQEIESINRHAYHKLFQRSISRLTWTPKPFYVATHHEKIDRVRADIIEYGEYYEKELTKRVIEIYEEKVLQNEKSIFLDVGGNIGWFSLVAAKHGASKVYTFEPNVMNTIRFCESLRLNDWLRDDPSKNFVYPITKGAGEKDEALQLMHTGQKKNPGSFSFQDTLGNGTEHTISDETIQVTTLDSFAERHGWFQHRPSIGLFKLDVELFELQVLRGARKLLSSGIVENIAMELKPKQTREDKEEILKILFEANFELYMHGKYKGPHLVVTKNYHSNWRDLLKDLDKSMYGENMMFRHRGNI